jgi:hypothetical protein
VVERPFGDRQVVQQILDRHLLIALGRDQAVGGGEDGVPPRRMVKLIDRTSHDTSINRPSVYLKQPVAQRVDGVAVT